MRILRTGECCPFCGQPLQQKDPEALRLLAAIADIAGLPEPEEEEQTHERDVQSPSRGIESQPGPFVRHRHPGIADAPLHRQGTGHEPLELPPGVPGVHHCLRSAQRLPLPPPRREGTVLVAFLGQTAPMATWRTGARQCGSTSRTCRFLRPMKGSIPFPLRPALCRDRQRGVASSEPRRFCSGGGRAGFVPPGQCGYMGEAGHDIF